MWSWWDCMQWWNVASDGSVSSAAVFLPMMLFPVVVIGGIVALVVMLIRSSRTGVPPVGRFEGRRQTPFEILSERFARGEIDRREYEERRGLLSQP